MTIKMDRKRIGQTLRDLRGDRSQKEIADALGVSKMAISQYERGERVPNDVMKIKIAEYFKKSISDIFFAA